MNWKAKLRENLAKVPYLDRQEILLDNKEATMEWSETIFEGIVFDKEVQKIRVWAELGKAIGELNADKGYSKALEEEHEGEILDDDDYEPSFRIITGERKNNQLPLPPAKNGLKAILIGVGAFAIWVASGLVMHYFNEVKVADLKADNLALTEKYILDIDQANVVNYELLKEIKSKEDIIDGLSDNLTLISALIDAGIDKDIIDLLHLGEKLRLDKSFFESGHVMTDSYGFRDETWFNGDGMHHGTDYTPAKRGDNQVNIPVDGMIIDFGESDIYGKYIIVENSKGDVRFKFAHLATIYWQDLVTHEVKGIPLTAGDKLGWMGATGLASGPHLHLEIEILVDGVWILLDPNEVVSKLTIK